MGHQLRVALRLVIAIVCIVAIVHLQREVSRENLIGMLIALAGLIGVLFDYNYDFNHPKRD